MSEEENSQIDKGIDNSMATPNCDMTKNIHVMLVDHDQAFVAHMDDLLKSYAYKVTTVETVPEAAIILSKGKKNIDVIIINVNSSDLQSFQLLAQAVELDIISLITCDEHNEILAKKSLIDGAYLYLKKPVDEAIVKHLWQFVFSKRIQKEKARQRLEENGNQMNVCDADDIGYNNIFGDEEQAGDKNIPYTEEQNNNNHAAENNVVLNENNKPGRKRGRKSTKEINEIVKRKTCTEWTVDLHARFVEAVRYLGEGRCYPKEILHVMNVPGLTRMQVASHLQKCRGNNWRSPKERRSGSQPSGQGFSSNSQKISSFKKFGTMPRLQMNVPDLRQQQYYPDQTQRGPEFPCPTLNNNNIFARGEDSIQQQLYHPQPQVQSHCLNIDNQFNNTFLPVQDNAGGGLQQQHGPSFGMLDSQGLQGTIIGSSDYGSGLAFNNGDHHNQNDYNFNLNAANITTYSGPAIMSGANIESGTINELGAANADLHQYIGEPNMFGPSNIIAASHASATEENDSKEMENCDAYLNFDEMDYLFQNLESPNASLPNEHGNELNQVNSDDMNYLFQNVESANASLPNEQGGELHQVYSDNLVAPSPVFQFPEIASLFEEPFP